MQLPQGECTSRFNYFFFAFSVCFYGSAWHPETGAPENRIYISGLCVEISMDSADQPRMMIPLKLQVSDMHQTLKEAPSLISTHSSQWQNNFSHFKCMSKLWLNAPYYLLISLS